MSDLLVQIKKDRFIKKKSGDVAVASVIEQVMSAVRNHEIDSGNDADDETVISIMRTEVKRLEDAKEQFARAGRQDLVDENTVQADYLLSVLPQLMSEDDIRDEVQKHIDSLDSAPNLGSVMGPIMGKLKGKADGQLVRKVVEELIG